MLLKIGMSLEKESQSKCNFPQNEMSLKMECQSKRKVTKNGMLPKIECHQN